MSSETSSAPPTCHKHGEQMVLTFFERPGSPPGNNWICRSCATVRAYEQSTARVAEPKTELLPWQIVKMCLMEALKPSHVPLLMSGWPESFLDLKHLTEILNRQVADALAKKQNT